MSLKLVQQVKAQLEAKGLDLSGPCGAFAIVKRVAWLLRDSGAGLLDKPAGNNCNGYAVDIVCYPNGKIRDILGDAGGANIPQWQDGELEVVDPGRYRMALDPGDEPLPSPPLPTPTPQPPSVEVAHLLIALDQLRDGQIALGQQIDTLIQRIDDTPPPQIPAVKFPSYVGRVPYLGTVTLTPKE